MHENFVLGNQIRLADRAVGNPCAHHDKKVRFVHRPIGIRFSVIANHAIIHGMLRRHNADAHHRGNNRNIVFFRKGTQLFFRTAEQHAATRADNRTLCFCQFSDDFFDLDGMSFDRRFVGPQIHTLRISKFLERSLLNVNRNINQNGASSAGIGDIKRLFEYPRYFIDIFDKIAVFHEGFHRACNIRFLENIGTNQFTVYLPGNAHERNTVCKSGRDTRNHIGRTGTGRDRADSHFSADPRQSACRVGRVLLRPNQNRLNIRFQNTVIKWTNCNTRIAKNIFYAFFFQTLYDCIRTYHSYPLFFYYRFNSKASVSVLPRPRHLWSNRPHQSHPHIPA